MKLHYISWNHLVSVSPWPLMISLSVFGLLVSSIYSWDSGDFNFFFFCLAMLLLMSYLWWGDVHEESLLGKHKSLVLHGFCLGMILFILSEGFFFFSFFWGYFHKVFSPGIELGSCWPPLLFLKLMIDPFSMPLLKTVILLSSGVTVTWSHFGMLSSSYPSFIMGMWLTFILGHTFIFLQLVEYSDSIFSFKSSVYGSSFYMLTGFHGLHVFMGSLYLWVCFMRGGKLFYSKKSHVSFILCSWYWHFVDVVWLFLYFFLYWYGF